MKGYVAQESTISSLLDITQRDKLMLFSSAYTNSSAILNVPQH